MKCANTATKLFYTGMLTFCQIRINPPKSKEMVVWFYKDRHLKNSVPKITIDTTETERAPEVKVLGVSVSDDLQLVSCKIVKRASKRVYMLYQRSGVCPKDILRIYIPVKRPVVDD